MKFFSGCMAVVGCIVCLFVGLIIFAGVVGSSSTVKGTVGSSDSAPSADPPEGKLVLKPDWKWGSGEYGTSHIRGRVVNKTGRDLRYAEIDFNLYDASGAQVDTAMTNTTNLAAGATWKFDALVLRPGDAKKAGCVKLEGH